MRTYFPWVYEIFLVFSILISISIPGCYGLGVIEPALYRSTLDLDEIKWPEGHIGRLWFSLRYEPSTEKLLVSLLKAKNLPSRAIGTVNSCDPFVRLHLMPDERRYLQSKRKEKTCNPYFDETLVFQDTQYALSCNAYEGEKHPNLQENSCFPKGVNEIEIKMPFKEQKAVCSQMDLESRGREDEVHDYSPSIRTSKENGILVNRPKPVTHNLPKLEKGVSAKDMSDHILKLTVIDGGRVKKKSEIGYVTYPLKNLEIGDGSEQQLFKMDLAKELQEIKSDLGELLVSMLYNENLNRLSVNVIEAKRLK
ncbi:hypothetical protein NQ317_004410, partial [Molorchus minor]